jgi:hypothetical protein
MSDYLYGPCCENQAGESNRHGRITVANRF